VKPKMDGIVILQQDHQRLLEAFSEEKKIRHELGTKRSAKIVNGLWKVLFKGLLVERYMKQYDH